MAVVSEGDLLWTPGEKRVKASNLAAFQLWLKENRGLEFADYDRLWQWSVGELEAFWGAIWEYFKIEASSPYERVLGSREMPGANWFPGAKMNYAQHMLRHEAGGETALFFLSERAPLRPVSWEELAGKVRQVATRLRELGIVPGDRIAACMPNIPETVVAMLAATSIGAVWSSCSPDFGTKSILDRFSQIEPKVLFCVDGYQYGGKAFDCRAKMIEISDALGSLEQVVSVPYLEGGDWETPCKNLVDWNKFIDRPPVRAEDFEFEQLPFGHPLWILFSSGTTGLPKPIVHGHGGITIELMKLHAIQKDLQAGDRMFFFTTTGWMMWNYLVSLMLIGGLPILYDGNPAYPEPDCLWKMVEETGASVFGASPTYIQIMEKAGIVPKEKFDLSSLRCVSLAGSPVSPEVMAWIYKNVKTDLWVSIGSGGTDVCTGFVEGVSVLPVRAGVIQGRALGVAAFAFNEAGEKVYDEVGELVITQPMPSMPLYFWNDQGNERYRETYFDTYPGIWRQGDFFKLMEDGGCFVLGRSDSTLNRHGIRIGTAEIYRTVEALAEVEDSLIVNLELPGGLCFMPLFVRLAEGLLLDEEIESRICQKLRADTTARHIPDKIYQISEVPYTLTMKKMEVPVRKILSGLAVDKAANKGTMMNPSALDFFENYQKTQKDYAFG
ncbi:MAG: acetoacetate--CoA ligase [Sphingomonadales bacterium]